MYKNQFYRSGKKNLTHEEYLEEEALCMEFETFLHHLLMTPSILPPPPKRIKLLAYCIYYRCITAPQLYTLLNPMDGELSSDEKYLLRQKKAGLLTAYSKKDTGLDVILYAITLKGVDTLYDYLSQNFLGKGISRKCLDFMKKRFQGFSTLHTFRHFISTRDLGIALLSCADTTNYEMKMETVLRTDGSIVGRDELINGSFSERGTFQCDSMVKYLSKDGITWNLFQEQDMYTQKRNILSGKINQYIPFCARAGFETNILLFSLDTSNKLSTENIAENPVTSYSMYRSLSSLPFDSWLYLTGCNCSNPAAEWKKLPLVDIARLYTDFNQSLPSNTGNRENALKIIHELLEENPYMTTGEAYERSCSSVRNASTEMSLKKQQDMQRYYYLRRNTVYNATRDVSDFQTAALNGMVVATVPNHDIISTLPTLFPRLFHEVEDSLLSMSYYYGLIPKPDNYTYEAMDKEGMIHFRNVYHFKDNTIYYENIAGDLGAYARVLSYLDTVVHPRKGTLICVSDENMLENLKNILLSSRYMEYKANGYAIPLRILFIHPEQLNKRLGLFEYTSDGSRHNLKFTIR